MNGKVISEGVNGKRRDVKEGGERIRIVAIGGDGLAGVEMFERETGKWTALPEMATERRLGPASCVVGGAKIVVAGGYDFSYLSSAEVFDFATKKWIAIAPMKEKRGYFSGVLLDDGATFLVTGGYKGAESTLASCEQLDTSTMTWSAAPAMATARSSHCAVLYKKNAVVLGGGTTNDNEEDTALCEEFDVTARMWTSFPPLTQTRSHHGACVLNDDKIFVCGGVLNDGSQSDSVEVFDGVKWSMLDAALSARRGRHACVLWEAGKVVLLGGDREHIEVYDEAENKWRRDVIPKMSTRSSWYLTAVSF